MTIQAPPLIQSHHRVMRRHVPLLGDRRLRTAAGLLLAAASPVAAAALLGAARPPALTVALFVLLAWLPAVWLTDKYRHKYPQRYDTYLLAAHGKAAVIGAVGVLALDFAPGPAAPSAVLWSSLAVMALGDALLSLPRVTAPAVARAPGAAAAGRQEPVSPPPDVIDAAGVVAAAAASDDPALAAFVRTHLPQARGANARVQAVADFDGTAPAPGEPLAMLMGRTPLNNVLRLNRYIEQCAARIVLGGYLAVRYTPLDETLRQLRRRYPGLLYWPAYGLHFLWYRALPKVPWLDRLYFFASQQAWFERLLRKTTGRPNRTLPKAEVWGRLAYWGFEVVAESEGDGDRLVLAQRASAQVSSRKPSFYAVVALEKVGLDGELIRLHKVRSMYPFSEFLQRRIYQSHGLTATGKFKNDFRLTEYGRLIRRHWIDELPGIYDWLRGDIKLVGMRATSPQFLSTYPQELYDLYVQIKPGLIPPIFDESTGGFEAIVRTELTYLERYAAAPIRTDLAYFWYTFRDIVFRRVRSH